MCDNQDDVVDEIFSLADDFNDLCEGVDTTVVLSSSIELITRALKQIQGNTKSNEFTDAFIDTIPKLIRQGISRADKEGMN